MSAIEVTDLSKVYRKGFVRRSVQAVNGISFAVERGETFGFLGPNGGGKTTTIRMLMGLIFPTHGTMHILGDKIPSQSARKKLGFLPEAPYFYDYLTTTELLDFTGRMFGQTRGERKRRAGELIELVGLAHAKDSPLKSYSKGMMQRAGIAQALMNDPELVVFDEPMSGLDPIGRKDVRDIILSLKEQGKTVFFSSHILSDVESVADRVAIIIKGTIHKVGNIRDLVSSVVGTEVVFQIAGMSIDDIAHLEKRANQFRIHGQEATALVEEVDAYVQCGYEHGGRLLAVTPIHQTLEDVFMEAMHETAPTNTETHP